MSHDSSQLDMPVHQLVMDSPPSVWTEIGEAQVTHTLFGKAKIRIIRKHDNVRRTLWLATLLAVVIAAAVWRVWFSPQQTESQSAETPPPASAKEQVSPPSVQPENISSSVIPPAAMKEPGTSAQSQIQQPAIVPKSASQPAFGLKGNESNTAQTMTEPSKPVMTKPKPAKPMTAPPKPVTTQPLLTGTSQTAPLAANNNPSMHPANKPLPKLAPAIHPVAPVVAAPRTSSSVVQSAASSPADVTPLVAPLGKEDAAQSPPTEIQAPSPASMPGK